MKIDQNQPGAWLGIGGVLILLGLIVAATVEDPGIGRFMMIAGAVLAGVGLLIFAIRAGTTRDRPDERDGLG